MKTNLLRKNTKLIIYIIGLLLITTLLYFTILRHKGYLYYWDLSGAFDFRDPFGQYFKMYTPWDEISIGIKNRMPLVSLIYLIYLPFKYIFGSNNEVVIKIATYLLFAGGYTTIYFLAPKFLNIFTKSKYKKVGGIYIWALIIALLYCFIPFYTYRTAQLNIFYMSIFYPIHVYLFIKLINQDRFNWKYVILFIFSMFIGLASPNIIIFDLMTFAVLFLGKSLINLKKPRLFLPLTLNLLLALIGTLVVNLYWLIPYVLEGSPMPGYVITQSVVDMLAQGVNLPNLLLGQSDWFVNQGDLEVLATEVSSFAVIQLLGCFTFYALAIFALLRYVKREYIFPLLILLSVAPLVVLDIFPYHGDLIQYLIFSPFGWIFREINRLSFLWYFWIFILFALGSYGLYEEIVSESKRGKLIKFFIFPVIFIPFVVYIFPVNVKFFEYLKPIEIQTDVKEVFSLLEDDEDFYSVFYYPSVDPFVTSWKEERFEISDVVDYISLKYNSPKPPVYNSSVIANAKSYQTLMTEYLFDNKKNYSEFGQYLDNIGVKYIVVRKDAKPILYEEQEYFTEVFTPIVTFLAEQEEFEIVLENNNYIVYENRNFSYGVKIRDNPIYSTDSFSILEHIAPEDREAIDINFCNFPNISEECYENPTDMTFLKYEDNEYFYLDFLSKDTREKYGIYIYDYVYDHRIGVDWGRGSIYDKVNGELHNVLRHYSINAWNFDIIDKFAFSDNTIQEENFKSSVTLSQKVSCKGECDVYAFVLNNHLGGDLTIRINDLYKTVSTLSEIENFRWIHIGQIESKGNVDITVLNNNGFQAIGGILVLPVNMDEDIRSGLLENNIIINISTEGYANNLPLEYHNNSVRSYEYKPGLIPSLKVKIVSPGGEKIAIKSFGSDYFVKRSSDNIKNVVPSSEFVTTAGESELDIYMIGKMELLLWFVFAINSLLMILLLMSLI